MTSRAVAIIWDQLSANSSKKDSLIVLSNNSFLFVWPKHYQVGFVHVGQQQTPEPLRGPLMPIMPTINTHALHQ